MSAAVGFIGLGQIGAPMAGHLVGWPDGLIIHDIDPAACVPLGDRGARVAASAAEVAKEATVISVMVRDDDQVRAVASEVIPVAAVGTVLAIHSTIRAETAEALAADAADHGVEVVDAPVTGGFVAAHEGTLAVMAGGRTDAIDRCREPFSRWASLVIRFGPVGAGTRAKLARALLTFVGYAAAFEAQRLAEAAGVSLTDLAAVVRHSDAVTGGPGVIMIRDRTGSVGADDPLHAILDHTRQLGEKDLDLALDLGRALGVDLPFTALARERLAPGLGLDRG